MKLVKDWKKVFEQDLAYVIDEFKEGLSFPCVVILTGDLGVGKTTWVKHYVGEKNFLGSPSYQLIYDYPQCAHADFYRIEEDQDMTHLELDVHVGGKDLIFVEWGKKYVKQIRQHLDSDYQFYELEIETNPANENNEISRNYSFYAL